MDALTDQLDTDDDNDGIKNSLDKCPNTPAGVEIDANGCPYKPAKIYGKLLNKLKINEMMTPQTLEFCWVRSW